MTRKVNRDREMRLPGGKLDNYTMDSLHRLVRYISSDRKIANYLQIPIEYVVWARSKVPQYCQITAGRTPPKRERPEELDLANEKWIDQARAASDTLAKALEVAA